MSDPNLRNTVKRHRERAGLSQQALAERAGVTRQAIIAIEQGRQVPSTALGLRLAAALDKSLESLFSIGASSGLTTRLAPAGEAARSTRVVLGEIAGRWVAHRVPLGWTESADGILTSRPNRDTAVVMPLSESDRLRGNVIVTGCAPVLQTLARRVGERFPGARATWLPSSSSRSLDLLGSALVHVAGLHVSDSASSGANADAVRQRFPRERMLVANLTKWRAGLVVPSRNPRGIRSGADLLEPGVRVALREQGAGAHRLLLRLLAAEGAEQVTIGGPFAAGHAEVAQLVRAGAADVGVAIEGVALAAGLGFIPLTEERFDLVVPASVADTLPVSRLIETLDDPSFRAEMAELPGYDGELSGHTTTLEAA